MAKAGLYRWNKDDELFPELENALYEATLRGYSVVEISRVLGNRGSRNLYGIMRSAGLIAKLPRGRRASLEVHPALLTALAKRSLSFHQWANSHDLNPVEVAKALSSAVDRTSHVSVAAHNAFKQDFPQLYCKVFQLPVEWGRAGINTPEAAVSDYHVIIAPDKENGGYRAFVKELENCSCFGKTRDEAYFALKSRYVLYTSILKLKVLPSKNKNYEEEREWSS